VMHVDEVRGAGPVADLPGLGRVELREGVGACGRAGASRRETASGGPRTPARRSPLRLPRRLTLRSTIVDRSFRRGNRLTNPFRRRP
jgi:hypothetical protein